MKVKAVKVTVKTKEKKHIYINTPQIELDSALKLAGCVSTGGQAKHIIQNNEVRLNGEICDKRGKKLKPGDYFEFNNEIYEVKTG